MSKDVLTKFHGMIVVSDYSTVKGHGVIEVNSNDEVVYREYDEDGNEINRIDIDIYAAVLGKKKITEAIITGFIKRQVGKNSILISESAVDVVKNFAD